jgi:hypothetical protein
MSLRHVAFPFEERLPEIHELIADLEGQTKPGPGRAEGEEGGARLDSYPQRIVPRGLGLLFGLGFLGWLSSLFLVVWLGFDPEGRPRRSLVALLPFSLLLLGSWILALGVA